MKKKFNFFLTALLLAVCQSISAQVYLVGDEPIGKGAETPQTRAMTFTGANTYTAEFVCFGERKFFVTDKDNAASMDGFNESRYVAADVDDGNNAEKNLENNDEGWITLNRTGRYIIKVVFSDEAKIIQITERTPFTNFDNIPTGITPKLMNVDEQSVFLLTKNQAAPYVYAANSDGTSVAPWPGQKMSLIGQQADGKYVFKWVSPYTTLLHHASITINDGLHTQGSDMQRTFSPYSTFNHGIFEMNDYGDYNNITKTGTVTDLIDRTLAKKNAVIYEINIRNFTSEGTFNAAKTQLAGLKNLGVTVISLMPITKRNATTNNPYAVSDQYDYDLGSFDDFKSFIAEAHNQGMQVILDVTLDRTSSDSRWVDQYSDCYLKENGNFVSPAGSTDVYLLDLSNTGAQWAIVNALENIVKLSATTASDYKTGLDGFRVMNAAGIPALGMSRVGNALRNINPNLVFVGDFEVNQQPVIYHQVGFDYDYAFQLQNDIFQGIGNGATTDQLNKVASFVEGLENSNVYTDLATRTIFTTNHEVNKNNTQNQLYGDNETALTVLTYTLPGVPLLYSGQESGILTNKSINYASNDYIGDRATTGNLYQVIQKLGGLRAANKALSAEAPVLVKKDNNAEHKGIVAFTREIEGDKVLVLLNLSNNQVDNIYVDELEEAKWTGILNGTNTTNGIPADVTYVGTGTEQTRFSVPAHGFALYELKDYYIESQVGIYMHPQSDPDGMNIKLVKQGDADVYATTFSTSQFYKYSRNSNKLEFNFREMLKDGDNVKWSDNKLTPAADASEITTAASGTATSTNDNNKFFVTADPNAKEYTLTVTKAGDDYTVSLTVKKEYVEGIYLDCQANEGGNNNSAFELTALATPDDEGYTHSIIITKDNFDTFTGGSTNLALSFKLQRYVREEGGEAVKEGVKVTPRETAGYIFRDTKEGNKYEECAWLSTGTNFFTINKVTGYASYEIRFMDKRNVGDATYVKVIFNPDYTWKGHTADQVQTTLADRPQTDGKIIYLYNVDTGKFIWNRGQWGTQATAPYTEFGMKMQLINTTNEIANEGGTFGTTGKPSYAFYTYNDAIPGSATQGAFLGYDENKVTYFNQTGYNRFWVDRGQKITDGTNSEEKAKSGAFRWHLTPIISGQNDVTTYLLSVELYPSNSAWDNKQRTEYYVRVTDDDFFGDPKLARGVIVAGGDNDLSKNIEAAKAGNYRWQIVTREDLINAFTETNAEAYSGMLADATFMFDNPDFARGLQSTIKATADNETSWKVTGDIYKWNGIVMDGPSAGAEYFGYLEGDGSLEQSFKPVAAGIYRVDLNGFTSGAQNVEMTVKVKEDLEYKLDNIQKISNDKLNQEKAKYKNDPVESGDTWGLGSDAQSENYSVAKVLYENERENYKNVLYFYVPEDVAAANTNGNATDDVEVTVKITQTGWTGDGYKYTAVDNFRCTFLGNDPFILKPTSTDAGYISGSERTKVPVYINRQFYPNAWQAICLPIDVTVAQLKQAFGQEVRLSRAAGLNRNDDYNIQFNEVDLSTNSATAIAKNEFYLVKPALSRSVPNLVERDGTDLNPVAEAGGYVSLGLHDMSSVDAPVAYSSTNFAPHKSQLHNAIQFVGLNAHVDNVPEKSYVFAVKPAATDGEEPKTALFHTTSVTSLDAFRFYISDVSNGGTGAKAYKYTIMETEEELIPDEDGNVQAVDRVEEEKAVVGREGIYTLSGQRIENGNSLPAGVYVINGVKVLVK